MSKTQNVARPQLQTLPLLWVAGLAVVLVSLMFVASGSLDSQPHPSASGGDELPPLWRVGLLPFVGILACIAILPLLRSTQRWWHRNANKLVVSLVIAALTLAYAAWAEGSGRILSLLDHAVIRDYVPFIILLLSLYVISGGICLKGDLAAHPLTNTAFLAVGSLAASVVGTTGASMLLIRPLLQTNSERRHVTHTVVFFIFLVSNIGGCLLPIGDPPLFLGYLKGVPFPWTLGLWKEWAFCCIALLVVYYIWDSIAYRREDVASVRRDETQRQPLRISGLINFVWLAGVVLAVALLDSHQALPGTNWTPPMFLRELIMLGLVALSLLTTPRGVRQENQFNYAAIIEVAVLFIGIFIAMQIPVEVLNISGSRLGLDQPSQFFWATGSLSSFLDNAPTYVVFFETANAMTHAPGEGVLQLLSGHFIREDLLAAISLGAVFMGANTYIGNGPNFMVKSIAEQSGVRMPSFLGYVILYTLPILVPLFVLVSLLFPRA